ncbi:uncharacterized protein LOC124355109 [Homalodisca vitripennis]|uniref:uncharacterized protein LOC124355109 n=1 Tax=Homalodisca vitripennis TaxID=197043 RepID=UPI001EECBEC5|nr:uncharacterized protein LOC124355109 [Homalodisca vitripennis]XP_046662022.1 uncharacterized protein LOC124355109 [Homalodisca vitripennis]
MNHIGEKTQSSAYPPSDDEDFQIIQTKAEIHPVKDVNTYQCTTISNRSISHNTPKISNKTLSPAQHHSSYFFRKSPEENNQEDIQNKNIYKYSNKNTGLPEQTTKSEHISGIRNKPKQTIKKVITILYQNCQEVKNKINRIIHFLESTKPDIVILTEHGLKDELLRNTRIPGYILKNYFSRELRRKGGVAIYVADDCDGTTEAIDIVHHCKEFTCEMAMVKVSHGKKHLYVIGIYRAPGEKLDEALDIISDVLEDTKAENYSLIIMGDINVDTLKPHDRDTRSLNERLNRHNLTRMKLPPTRITPLTVSSIDCVCTNLNLENLTTSIIEAGISDHTAQLTTAQFKKTITSYTSFTRRQLNKDNIDTLRAVLENEDWNGVYG